MTVITIPLEVAFAAATKREGSSSSIGGIFSGTFI